MGCFVLSSGEEANYFASVQGSKDWRCFDGETANHAL